MKECPCCHLCWDDGEEKCPSDDAVLEAVFEGPPVVDGKYCVERKLGEGGMGTVYRVLHLGLGRHFALKLIRPARGYNDFATLFRKEAKALGKLKHPNIVEVTDYGVDPRGSGLPYLVMEYLKGTTLRALLDTNGALSAQHALTVLEPLALALDYAHQRGVVHRDLKPGNIFLSEDAEPKILDFGLSQLIEEASHLAVDGSPSRDTERGMESLRHVRQEVRTNETVDLSENEPQPRDRQRGSASVALSRSVTAVGTIGYMAPEIIRGQGATPASDIYAFGVLCYETLVGRPPFTGTAAEILVSQLEHRPSRPSQLEASLPPELDEAALAPLAMETQFRPASATEVVHSLRHAWSLASRRRWMMREIPRRLGISALLVPIALLVAFLTARAGPVQQIEWRTEDARLRLRPAHAPDPRILLVSIDEESLAADKTPLAERSDEFGEKLQRVYAAGARAVAIDFLLPEPWSRSRHFSRLVLERAETLTLAAYSSPLGGIVGTECVRGLTTAALGGEKASALFGVVNLEEDEEGVIRRARLYYEDRDGSRRLSWAAQAAGSLGGVRSTLRGTPALFRIDHSVDWIRFDRVLWKDLTLELDARPWVFRDRLVLVGGDFAGSGDDYHWVPLRSGELTAVSGLVLQAIIVDTILSGLPVRHAGALSFLLTTAALSFTILAVTLSVSRVLIPYGVFLGLCALYGMTAIVLFEKNAVLLRVVAPLLTALFTLSLALWLRWSLPAFPREL